MAGKPSSNGIRPYRFPTLHASTHAIADYASAQQSLDAGYEAGRQQGYDEGFVQGKDEGFVQGKKEGQEQGLIQGRQQGEKLGRQQYEQALPGLAAITQQLQATFQQQVRDQKEQILLLVRQVTERILPAELTLNPVQIQCLVEECCNNLPDPKQGVKIYLNPADKKRLINVRFQAPEGWPLLEDAALATGDCRIESTTSVIEASISKQIAESIKLVAEQLEATQDE